MTITKRSGKTNTTTTTTSNQTQRQSKKKSTKLPSPSRLRSGLVHSVPTSSKQSSSTGTNKPTRKMKDFCKICYNVKDKAEMFSIEVCNHRYCFSCMTAVAKARFLAGKAVRCPHERCKSEVTIKSCLEFLDPKLIDLMTERRIEASIPAAERVYCPNPKCSALMLKKPEVSKKCVKCNLLFCVKCHVPWHFNLTCAEYKTQKPHASVEERLLKDLVKSKNWRQCAKCNHLVELVSGCYHVSCRCGYEFCYKCGAERKNNIRSCSCPAWEERFIIQN